MFITRIVSQRTLSTNSLHKSLPAFLQEAVGSSGFTQSTKRHHATDSPVKRTCLYDFHVSHGAKMVPFAGYMMPVQYAESIGDSHRHVRKNAGLFDVSHMLQTKIHGKDRIKFIESLVVSDINGLKENQGCLTVFTNEKGGIKDDLIVMKTQYDFLFVVSNAGCAEKDLANLQQTASEFRSKGLDVDVEVVPNGLLALQGPGMVKALQPGLDFHVRPGMVKALQPGLDFHVSELPFMRTKVTSVYGIPDVRVTRCGYTGEDGVEISVDPDKAVQLTQAFLDCKTADVHLIGLGARDSLRLDAGLCLYGHDIDDDTTPVEAALAWTIGKRRRELADFPGASIILEQLKNKASRRRVGMVSHGPPAREGTAVLDESGTTQIGAITSGGPSPSLGHNIAMGYLQIGHTTPGSKVKLQVRKKLVDADVIKMPFVKTNYYVKK